jgi:GNAT superfamily N-acetyltransferase
MIIRPLELSHVERALRLSTQAGWNQVEADWRRLIHLWPQQCLGGWLDDQLVATGTLATYPANTGPVGWVGMILVDRSHRGRGLGTAIMEAVLKTAERLGVTRLGVTRLGLDASDQGEPIYRRLGFQTCTEINRWTGRGALDDTALFRRDKADWPKILSLDLEACRADRSALLYEVTTSTAPDMRWLTARDRALAYGIVRPGRLAWHVGPLVATDIDSATRVVDDLIGTPQHQPYHDIIIDVPEHSPLEPVLRTRNFAIARRLKRMCRGPTTNLLASPQIFAAMSFELG